MTPSTSLLPPADTGEWTELDRQVVDTARILALDAVEKVGNGHPGTAMSLAPAVTLLFQRFLRHDPTDPAWAGRDRFVLSCGHSSLTLYLQLFFSGYGLELEDLKSLRTWDSATPGHPEHGHTPGVETTTGPLGNGVGNAVGMAAAARRARGLFDPETSVGDSIFDHTIWCVASDGDLQEGVSAEASAFAGHQQLGDLVLIWDDNRISIEDDTAIASSEDTAARYAAYGWHVQTVDDGEDIAAVSAAFHAAQRERDRPSFIALRTTIGFPAPNAQDTGAIHGSAAGADEVAATKRVLGFDPAEDFAVADEVLAHARAVVDRGRTLRATWDERFELWAEQQPERAELFARMAERRLPADWAETLPVFPADPKGMATRKASGEVLSAIAPALPELWGGSADLAGSNNTTPKGEPSFVPSNRQTSAFSGGPYGRVLHFGIREHAMGSIMNGMALHGGTRPYGGTFLVFSDYMRPAVRLAALMKLPVTYVWTHDSIGLGEDGPTHQPVEHLAALRAIPGLDIVRPADANETVVAWRTVLERDERPTGLCLSRQNVPTFDRSVHGDAEGTARGAYVLAEASSESAGGVPEVILLSSGSELQLAVAAREVLEADGVPTRVVSMPCMEWFRDQDAAYREQVLPVAVTLRVSIEAGIAMPWREWVGPDGAIVSLEHFGASASAEVLFERFGLTANAVVVAARDARDRATA
jgi:transketolase